MIDWSDVGIWVVLDLGHLVVLERRMVRLKSISWMLHLKLLLLHLGTHLIHVHVWILHDILMLNLASIGDARSSDIVLFSRAIISVCVPDWLSVLIHA